jgi:hypothetical protein
MRRRGSTWRRIELSPATAWECPCGTAPPEPGATATPVRTVVSLREPECPFCGRRYRDAYRVLERGEPR